MRTDIASPGEHLSDSPIYTSPPKSYTLGMFQYGEIPKILGSLLEKDKNYSVRSTRPHYFSNNPSPGIWETGEATGEEIMADCQSFFPKQFESYKVFEEGNPEPILIFNSSTPQKVAEIISQLH